MTKRIEEQFTLDTSFEVQLIGSRTMTKITQKKLVKDLNEWLLTRFGPGQDFSIICHMLQQDI